MKRRIVSVVFWPVLALAALAAGYPASGSDQSGPPPNPPKKQAQQKSESLAGCIDQQDGRYVLLDAGTMRVVAALESEGFPTEGFAKYVGHRVTVRGISIPAGAAPRFRVRSIESVSDTCAP